VIFKVVNGKNRKTPASEDKKWEGQQDIKIHFLSL
jgi:hypothetical protein